MEHTKISLCKTKDNLHALKKRLDSLIRKIENKEIIIKPADKGSVIAFMLPDYYSNICQSDIPDISYYRILNYADPSDVVQQRVTEFADKYKPTLTLKEYCYLTKRRQNLKSLHASKITKKHTN